MLRKTVRYNCEENDNIIVIAVEDGELEIWDGKETEAIIIGLNDLQQALTKVGYSITKA